MILYKLICKDCEISFDSWFSSSREYEKLKKNKFLNCHTCGSLNVQKTLMSPSVLRSKNNTKIDNQNSKDKEIKKITLEYQNFIKKNFDYVGQNFSYEVRSRHYNNNNVSKGVCGTASKEELKELNEEGIKVEMMPWIKNIIN
jgi:hypothetical protein|tara:strand:+ start:1220 stop:1648 length:429 start_codon:yes stop_codon:yes gene_type:complete